MSDASSDANKALTRQFFRRVRAADLRAADLSAVDELVSDAFVEHEQVPGLAPGKAGMRQLFEMFHSAFDQAGLEVDDMIAEGDKVFVLARMTGTQRGEFMGVAPDRQHHRRQRLRLFPRRQRRTDRALGSHGRRRDDAATDRALTIQERAVPGLTQLGSA
jgi:predicted ester cyclase